MSTADTRPIRFYHRGRIVEVADVHPTKSVLDWLREDARCTGTKEGCNEGDCGACTVVIGEPADRAKATGRPSADATVVRGLSLRSVNACIQFLPTLDGKALFTVEDLQAAPGNPVHACGPRNGSAGHGHPPAASLHPVQQAMVECHGSQCGFCTPGFVMSMWASYERHGEHGTKPSRRDLADELSGNLCRCTGYRPILDAGERMFELDAVRLDTKPVLDALATIARSGTFHYAARHPGLPGAPVHEFHAPRTIDGVAAVVADHPNARILAGSTDIGLWVNKMFRELPTLVYVGEVAELKRIDAKSDGTLVIGAGASLEDAWLALSEQHPGLREMGLRFASLPIRNAGTMGGNVANGSPIGDSPPVLLALDARIVLQQRDRIRTLPLSEFYVDYMKNRLEPGEFVRAIEVPAAPAGLAVRAYKISKRYDCDISAVATGFGLLLDGDTVKDVRLAYGGMAGICKRALHAETVLRGQPWTEASVRTAQAALEDDFTPLTDMRSSAEHRMRTAKNLIERFWLETRTHDPVAAEAATVWKAFA